MLPRGVSVQMLSLPVEFNWGINTTTVSVYITKRTFSTQDLYICLKKVMRKMVQARFTNACTCTLLFLLFFYTTEAGAHGLSSKFIRITNCKTN